LGRLGELLHREHGLVEEVERYVLGHLMLLMRDEFVVGGKVLVLGEKEQNGHRVVSGC
jgi:hypothetical protein